MRKRCKTRDQGGAISRRIRGSRSGLGASDDDDLDPKRIRRAETTVELRMCSSPSDRVASHGARCTCSDRAAQARQDLSTGPPDDRPRKKDMGGGSCVRWDVICIGPASFGGWVHTGKTQSGGDAFISEGALLAVGERDYASCQRRMPFARCVCCGRWPPWRTAGSCILAAAGATGRDGAGKANKERGSNVYTRYITSHAQGLLAYLILSALPNPASSDRDN